MSLLDDQLSDKSRSARGHVEELMLLRTRLAQEKASLAIVRQEIQEQAAREVGAVRGAHERKTRELEGKLRRVRAEREKLEGKVVEMKTKLSGKGGEIVGILSFFPPGRGGGWAAEAGGEGCGVGGGA